MSYHKDAKGLGAIETAGSRGSSYLKRDKSHAYLDIYMLEKQKEIYQNIEKSMGKRKTALTSKLLATDRRINKIKQLQLQEPYLENKKVEDSDNGGVEDTSSYKDKEAFPPLAGSSTLEKKWKKVTLQY